VNTEYRPGSVQMEIIRHVGEHPGCTTRDLSSSLKFSQTTIVNAIVQLKEERLIEVQGTVKGPWGKEMDCLYLTERAIA